MTAFLFALSLLAQEPSAAGRPVRLGPVECADADLPAREVRSALRVEMRQRLLEETAAGTGDFILVSVACDEAGANLLAVRQGAGTPARRLVPFRTVAAEARPRVVALAISELVRVEAVANLPAPPPVVALRASQRRTNLAFAGSPILFSGYFGSSSGSGWWSGGTFRLTFERGPHDFLERTWGWGVALEGIGVGTSDDLVLATGLLASVRRSGPVAPELGIGARLGEEQFFSGRPPDKTNLVGGPFASFGLDFAQNLFSALRLTAELGYDAGGKGAWALVALGGVFRPLQLLW